MSREFNFQKKHIIALAGVTLIIILALFTNWILALNNEIDAQLEKKRFSPPLEFYSAPIKYFKGLKTSQQEIVDSLKIAGFREREPTQALADKDYSIWPKEVCNDRLRDMESGVELCVVVKKQVTGSHAIALSSDNVIIDVYDVDSNPITLTELDPVLFAQFYGKEPIMRTMVQLGDTPPICLNALLAIEDQKFLEHQGISVLGILRAFIRNLTSGKVVQGGSTITQQLVKNYFLTHERTFSRKFKEVFMALLIETKSSKDDILEAYINEIYMGQNGSFQIRGFGAASEYYFGKHLSDLDLPECSLLAAVVNSPGLFSPFRNPENATERRKKVLVKLLEEKAISETEMNIANLSPLPKTAKRVLSEPAPYFVDAVMRELVNMGADATFGLKIETTLNLKAQEAAQIAVRNGIENLEKNNKIVKELKEKGKNLEGMLVSADPTNGHIQAIVGGRSFKLSQYNRAIQSRRQVGSIIKPFVFLAALESVDESGEPYQPLTLLSDDKFKIKYEGQEWSPKNYGNKYYGQVPMYFALKSSLNSATASLGIKIGLEDVIDAAKAAGIETPMRAFPALTLGVFELPALEVLQAYATLARMGEKTKLTMIRKIKTLDDEVIYENVIERDQTIEKQDAAVLIGMMKQTILNGTAIGAYANGFTHPAAGKTGTTNDFKDAWFAGFTPLHVAVTWVGYDDNTSAKLTGSSGGVPIWTQYMKQYTNSFPAVDFELPEDTETKEISIEDQKAMNIPEEEKRPLQPIQLIFKD